MKKNIIGQIGYHQSYANSVIKVGQGFERTKTLEEPFITLHVKPVYHISKNAFPFDELEFNIRKVYKWGEYYDPYFMSGMPNVEACIKLYVDTRIDGWYILWLRNRIDRMYFDEVIVNYNPVTWIKRTPDLAIELAGYYMFIAHIKHTDESMVVGKLINFNEENGYWRSTWYPSLRCELAFSCIRKTVYQSLDHLNDIIALTPPKFREILKENAVFDSKIDRYEH